MHAAVAGSAAHPYFNGTLSCCPGRSLSFDAQEYLEFVVPGQSAALVEEVRTLLAQKQIAGGILFATMLFFSALAFIILENAMSVIFFHRVKIKRRHFLVSAVMPYLFLGVGLLIEPYSPGCSRLWAPEVS